jgi:WhiB family redox-sensing transcriptional regulator
VNPYLKGVEPMNLRDYVITPDWHHRAECRNAPEPDMFFPHATANVSPEVVKACRRCPVSTMCAADAAVHRDEYGVWGGRVAKSRRSKAAS